MPPMLSARSGMASTSAAVQFIAFSFAPTKQVASSNGGVLLFKDASLREKINQLAFLGLAVDTYGRTVASGVSPTQQVVCLGHKYKADDLASAVAYAGIGGSTRLSPIAAGWSTASTSAEPSRPSPAAAAVAEQLGSSWYIMPVRAGRAAGRPSCPSGGRGHRQHRSLSQSEGAAGLFGYRGDVPVTAAEAQRVISLPLHESVTSEEVDRICDEVQSFFGQAVR